MELREPWGGSGEEGEGSPGRVLRGCGAGGGGVHVSS